MNKSSSSASSSPPFTTLPPPPTTLTKNSNQRTTPSVIPLEYNYRIMSPSSLAQIRQHTAINATRSTRPQTVSTEADISFDNTTQYNSLFGDPVPPPPPPEPDFFGPQLDSRAASLFHSAVGSNGSSEGENTYGSPKTIENIGRLFSNIPYTSLLSQRFLNSELPRLQPPDIQILPNSSSGSSGGEGPHTKNISLFTLDDTLQRQSLYGVGEPADVSEYSETVFIKDSNGVRKYSEATKRMSNFSADFKANVGSLSTSPVKEDPLIGEQIGRQFSKESYSSSEWFRPSMNDFPEFSKMPQLRPSSKNVMSIKRDEMPPQRSPVAAMINDSNGSVSSGEERLMNSTQTLIEPTVSLDILAPPRPLDPSPTSLRDMDTDSLTKKSEDNSPSPPMASSAVSDTERDFEANIQINPNMSPVIMRDSISTGSDFRVDNVRLHKKTSFTIISERSPQSSRSQTPSKQGNSYLKPVSNIFISTSVPTTISPPSLTLTPTSLTTAKPTVKPQNSLQQKSLTSTELRVPHLLPQLQLSDDSPRPSVQFDMSGRYSPGKMPQKGILQHRESVDSSLEIPLPTHMTSHPPPVPRRRPSVLPDMSQITQLSTQHLHDTHKRRRCETLPLITDPYRTAIPKLYRSAFDMRENAVFPPGDLPRPLKPNPNPTRKQRGLLRVFNGAEINSRIPLRSNWTASADDLTGAQRRRSSTSYLHLQKRRRSSSTSPERRSSTQTTSDRRSSNLSSVTTSDFSFRRPSLTTAQSQRRQSIFSEAKSMPTTSRKPKLALSIKNPKRGQRTKISKPSTLSPIIGTPNKDSSSQPSPVRSAELSKLLNASETLSESTSRRDSVSKIPVRNGVNSLSNSQLSSHPGSRIQSRSSSPAKELTIHTPINSRNSRAASSLSPPRISTRTDSRPTSRSGSRAIVSRPSSRASTRPLSRGAPSQSSSRSNSRLEEIRITKSRPSSRMDKAREEANYRSNSHASRRSSTGRAISGSPKSVRKRTSGSHERRKSVSLSPNTMRRSTSKRRSPSPHGKRGGKISERPLERRKSRSRIPTRAKSDLSAAIPTRSTSVGKHDNFKRTASARKISPSQSRKQPTSAKKVPTSARKPESSVKRATSSLSKPSSMTTKKQPSNVEKIAKKRSNDQKPTNKGLDVSSIKKAPTKSGPQKQEKPGIKRGDSSVTKDQKNRNLSKQLSKVGDRVPTTKGKSEVAQKSDAIDSSALPVDIPKEKTNEKDVSIATAAGAPISGTKGQPSPIALMRMGSRLSLLSKKRPDSALSGHITEEMEESKDISEKQTDESHNGKLNKVNSSAQLVSSDDLPAAILEKSQKTLEHVQKTVTVATDEIHRKINENLTDLKTFEQDFGRISDGAVSPTASIATVVENRNAKTGESTKSTDKSPQPLRQPIEASVSVLNTTSETSDSAGAIANERVSASTAMSVLPEVECESANFQKFHSGIDDQPTALSGGEKIGDDIDASALGDAPSSSSGVDGIGRDRQSPDGQGGSPSGSGGGRTDSRELLDAPDDHQPKGCCRCCARFCMPCRRARCSRCCSRKKKLDHDIDESENRPVLSATSSTTTTNLDVIDETAEKKKNGCWRKLNCLKKKKNNSQSGSINEEISKVSGPMRGVTPPINMGSNSHTTKQGKCGACLRKVFCCRSANKVETTTNDDEEVANKKCACFPCCRKKAMGSETGSRAWQDPEQGLTPADSGEGAASAVKDRCCRRIWRKIFCCCRKKKALVPSNSRRASMKAPPPPVEDTRRKLHNDLVEYTSKMKGAIPVLPLYLAWFCAICNTLFPGLGTLFSGIFCICVGIPRFSQYDSAKARLGSFIINTIVAASQLFCVLFCFVGWGWSIWWGTIMLKCAKKLNKIKKVERLEMEEEQRQAAAAAAIARAEAIHATGTTETTKT